MHENSDNHGNIINSENNLVADYKDTTASAKKIMAKLGTELM